MPLGLVGPSDWVPVGPLLYQRVGGGDYLAFGTDERGRTSHLYGTFMIPLACERVRWYEAELVLLGLLAFAAVLSLWLGYAMLRSWRAAEGPVTERRVHAIVALSGVLFLWQMSYWNVLGF